MRAALLLGVALAINPISRVAQLLEGLSKQIETDGKAEEKLFKAYTCWYKQTTAEKTASNTEANARIEELTTFIDDVKNGRIEFTTDRVEREKELAAINAQIEKATAMRKQEKADFEAAKEELNKGITALQGAVDTMTAGTEGSFLVRRFNIRKVMSLAADSLSTADMGFLERMVDVPEKDWEKLNREATFKKKYKHRSGAIQDTLKKMLKSFQDDLDSSEKKEKNAQDTYDNLMDAKNEEKSQAEAALLELKEENGARGMNLNDAESEKDDLERQVENDTKFINQVQESYDAKLGEWKERKRLRSEEVAGISEAMSILRSDESRDLFNKSFESQGYLFLQRAKENNNAKNRALAQIYSTFQQSGDSRRLAKAVQKLSKAVEGVQDVITAIDEMLGELKTEDDSDHDWKEECEKFSHEKKKEALRHSRSVDDEQATIERKQALIEELTEKIAVNTDKIAKINEEMKEAKRMRQEEKAEYESSKSDDKAAVVLIERAVQALGKFYKNNNLALMQQRRTQAPGEAPAPPPTTWDAGYGGKKGENEGVVGILTLIKEDVEKDIRTADKAESDSLDEHNKFISESEANVSNLEDEISNFEGSKANAMEAESTAQSEKKAAQTLLAAEVSEYKAKEPDCTFIAVNFKLRQTNRHKEIDGLKKAKTILQGGDF